MQKNKKQIKTMRRPSVDRKQEDRSMRKGQGSFCECYCKLKETNDESSPLSSQRFIDKNTENKCEKMTAPPTTIGLGIESSNRQQSKTNVLESPTVSPDTQKAIENAEKILEEVRYKIAEAITISTSGFRRGIKKELYTDDLEPPLEDEIEENLYIRELVSSRLNKINDEISEDFDVSTDRKGIVNNKVTKKRSIDLLAPKFRTMEHRCRDILYRPTIHSCTSFEKIKSESTKSAVSSETKSDNLVADTKTRKTKSLIIQNGPPLNIDRELKKQDLGFVHISPDSSYVENNTNINFYSFSHESCKKKDAPVKSTAKKQEEKSIDNVTTDVIDKLDRSTNENQSLTEEIRVFEEKSFAKDNVAVLTDILGKEDDVLFEGPINNGREKKDRGNASEHLPRTGVDYCTLNDEPNSYYLNDVRRNEEIMHYKGKKITQKICSRDIGTDVPNSISKDERSDTIQLSNVDEDSYCYEKRTNDEATKIEDGIKKGRKKKMIDRVNFAKNIKTVQERDLSKECHNVIDKRFSDIFAQHDPSGKVSNKGHKFNEEKESTDLSDISLQDTDISFNDIELNAPSIETFDNMLLVCDKVIDRVSKSEKKIEDTLRRLELSLSNESSKPVITNTAVKSYDLIPFKKTDNFYNIDKNDPILLLSNKSKSTVVEREEDKLEINPCMSNNALKKEDSSFFKKKSDLKNESRLIKKQGQKITDAIRSDESNSSIDNVVDENKILEFKRKIKALSSNEKLKSYESDKDDAHVEPLSLKNEKWREKKVEFEHAIINSLPGVSHTPTMLEEIMKHLQSFSNTHSQDIPAIFKKFIMDVMNRESGLVLDFLSVQKQDSGTIYTDYVQNGNSLQAIAQNDECKIQKDIISDSYVLKEPSAVCSTDRIITSKEKSLKVCPINLIEIKPTGHLIDELSQTEIEVLEKGTQYEVSYEQNHSDGDDRIVNDVPSEKSNAENILEKSNKINEYPTREIKINISDIKKSQFVKNDDSERDSKNSEENIINMNSVKNTLMKDLHSDLNFSKKILDKLSDSEDCSSRSNTVNVKRIHANVSRLTTTSSETSHSEGELYLPSSCSYSLGELRMVKNSASMCSRALVSTSTASCLGETTSLLRHSSGEIYVDSSDTL